MQFSLTLGHEGRVPTVIMLSLSMPSRDPAHLLVLMRERLSNVVLAGRVESIALTAVETMQLAPRNFSFFGDRDELAENRLALVERLRARLGDDAVCGLALVPDHRPELAWQPNRAAPPSLRPRTRGRSGCSPHRNRCERTRTGHRRSRSRSSPVPSASRAAGGTGTT
jgi:protein ImuB